MTPPSGGGLALAFTPGTTIADWERGGLLDREVRYYRRLAERVGPVTFVSEGPRAAIAGIATITGTGPLFWPGAAFALRTSRPRILKTNQLAHSTFPILARAVAGTRIVARGGYVGSEPWRHVHVLARRQLQATAREWTLCKVADLVIVTTPMARQYVISRYRPRADVVVVPNFVEHERFALDRPKQSGLVTIVGRLTAEKNVLAAIEAVAGIPGARLRIVGDGPFRTRAERAVTRLGVNAEFRGRVPYDRIPALLAESEAFLMPSHFEGHPKALVEAMAAGVACVVAPSPGLAEAIDDGVNGIVAADASAAAIREAVSRVLGDAALRDRLGRAARAVAMRFSVDRVLELEWDAYRSAGLL